MTRAAAVLFLVTVWACPHQAPPRPARTYVRIDARDSADPGPFVTRLEREVANALVASGSLSPGYPKACRWESATGRVTYCLAEPAASFHETHSFLLNDAGYALTFRLVDFPSPLPFAAQVYLLPSGSARALLDPDRDRKLRRVLVIGGPANEALQRGILAAGAVPAGE